MESLRARAPMLATPQAKLDNSRNAVSSATRVLMLHSPTDLAKRWQSKDGRSDRAVFDLGANMFVYATGKWQGLSVIAGKSGLFLVLSALATGASWVCYYRALKIGNAVNVAPVDKLSVVLVALFAVVFLGERPVARDWLGIALVAVGVVLLALKGR